MVRSLIKQINYEFYGEKGVTERTENPKHLDEIRNTSSSCVVLITKTSDAGSQ